VSDHRSLHISLPNRRPPKPRTLYTLPINVIQDLTDALGRRLTKTVATPTTIPDLEDAAWHLLDTVEGTTRKYSIRFGGKPKSLPWWRKNLAEIRDTCPEVYRKTYRQIRTSFYKAKIETARSLQEFGKILQDITTYLADATFRPANTRTLPPYAHHGPTLPPALADKYLDAPSDGEVFEAFYGYTSNTPGPDGIPFTVVKAAWEHILPHAKVIATAALALGKFPT
ncbi:hypothetical protein QBC32DRAFT_320197, partial [Pseudoneurospora amorphoporcata]